MEAIHGGLFVALANLRSGDIDFMHLVNPTDAASLRKEGKFEVASVPGIGYSGFNINLRNKNGKPPAAPGDLGTPLANDPRVREALELSIDREALNQVVWEGQYTPDCTPISPVSPFYDKSRKCPTRDVARAKKLLADAGLAGGYSFTLTVQNQRLEHERDAARLATQRSGQVQAFVLDLLRSPDPFGTPDPEQGRAITVVDALQRGADERQA